MSQDAITAAVIRTLNEKIDALPMGAYGSRQKFLEAASAHSGNAVSDEALRKVLTGKQLTFRIDYFVYIVNELGVDAGTVIATALSTLTPQERAALQSIPAQANKAATTSDGTPLPGDLADRLDQMANALLAESDDSRAEQS